MSEYQLILNDLTNFYFLTSEAAISQYIVILLSVGLFILTRRKINKFFLDNKNIKLSHNVISGVQKIINPIVGLIFVSTLSLLISFYYPTNLLNLFEILLIALIFARLGVYSLRFIFKGNPLLKAFENIIALLVWIYTIIYILGYSSVIAGTLEGMSFKVVGSSYNLLMIIQLIIGLIFAIAVAMSLATLVERSLKNTKGLNANLKSMINKLLKLLIYITAVIITMDTLGIDITFLSVFGGAFAVGLGFGMQNIVSNYISGFTILMDKSLHIGDILTIGEHYGIITSIKSRYTVLRKLEGVEVIIPNNTLITENIINHTYMDRNVRVWIDIQISYKSSVDLAKKIMHDAAIKQERVMKDPEPNVYLFYFNESGIDLKLVFFIKDAEEGQLSLKSEISEEIWREFQKQGVEIPFPQRDLHIKSGELKS
jgi:small-conductance mechanosensitive channel